MKTKIIEFLKPDSKKIIVLQSIAIVFLLLLVNLSASISEIYYFISEEHIFWAGAEMSLSALYKSNNTTCWHIIENKTGNLTHPPEDASKYDKFYREFNKTRKDYSTKKTIALENLRDSQTIKFLGILAPFSYYDWTGIYKDMHKEGCNLEQYPMCFVNGKILRAINIIILSLNIIYWYIISCIMLWSYNRVIITLRRQKKE